MLLTSMTILQCLQNKDLQATDLDEGENAVVHYKLVGDFKVKKDENIEHIETPFYVNSVSGEVALNFYPKSDMKGDFDFDVMAYDKDNLNSTTQVLIYLLREDQQVHLTLKIKVDDLSEEKRMKLKRLLENVLSEIVIIDDYRAYAGDDNRYNPQEYTDVLFHVVQEEDNSVMEAEEALKLTRKLRAATATSFGSQDSGLNRIGINNLPNTNKHTVEGSNPMWNCQTQLNSQEDAYSMNGSEISLDLKDFDGYFDFLL
ncbi:cadherin-AgCad1-like isoform X2 [Tachypleus tridentatus]|uniref:cadherin-AgCad1-like isoform X2 n=1 Tax=Tachypleus tridentatus TaxID=6853 RepID=UPI003FD60EAA